MGAAELARGRGKQANFEFEYLTQKTRFMRVVFFPHLHLAQAIRPKKIQPFQPIKGRATRAES